MIATPTVINCRKCGAGAPNPIYSEERYNERPALFWTCPNVVCGYAWSALIYSDPETEIRRLKDRIQDLERGHE